MTQISLRLRAARERAGLSIEQMAAITKIRVSALQAIERGEFERLPGDFYARAFLRTYARELHVAPDEIIHQYEVSRARAQPQPEMLQSREQPVAEPAHTSPRGRAPRALPMPPHWLLFLSRPRNAGAIAALAAVLLLMMLVKNRPLVERPGEPGAVATTGVASTAPTASGATPPAAETVSDKLILEIHPSGPIWVTGAADGHRVLYRLLAPGERVTVEARNDLTFRIGNAAAFTYAINGLPGKPLGGPGEIREFRITRENYRTFGR